jgi:fatty acid-binding protein DegV
VKLRNCMSESEQVTWAVEHLKKGGRIHEISLWLGGVDRPMQIVAKVKLILRAQGRIVTKAIETVRDVAGEDHHVLSWRLKVSEARQAEHLILDA